MKKYVSILIVLVLIFTINVNVFATTTPVTDTLKGIGLIIEDFKQANQYTWTQISDFLDTMSQVVGLPKKGHSSGGHSFDPHIIDNIDPEVDTDDPDSVGTWISNQISIQDNDDITVTNDFRTMFNDFNDSLSRSFCYTYDINGSASVFNYTNLYVAVKDKIPNGFVGYQKGVLYIATAVHVSLSNSNYIMEFDSNLHPYMYLKPYTASSPVNVVSVYDGLTNQRLNPDKILRWNTTEKDWETVTANPTTCGVSLNPDIKTVNSQNGIYNFAFNEGLTQQFRYFPFGVNPTAEDILYQPYYYNNEVWTDFSTSSGDYTFSSDNINTVTYGDITSYINSFNDENSKPPTVSDINIYIDNKNDENNQDDNGGGGGSGSDDNDGGSIFDWLKNLGKVLGDLIKGIGEFITEIIAGLVSALNDLMSSLSGLITDTLGSLTTVFSSIIDFVYAGLPDSVKGIMMLALTVSLLITVIQLIRK